jgi:hypothetical protein
MKSSRHVARVMGMLAIVLICSAVLHAQEPAKAEPAAEKELLVGIGYTAPPARPAYGAAGVKMAKAAGLEAAKEARAMFGADEPKIVFLFEGYFDKADAGWPAKNAILDAVAEVFPREKIYGIAACGIFTDKEYGYRGAVSVLALGGDAIDIEVRTTEHKYSDEILDDAGKVIGKKNYYRCTPEEQKATEARWAKVGKPLAASFGNVPDKSKSFLLLFGDLHSPSGDYVVKGIQSAWGKDFPIIGAAQASWGGDVTYTKGTVGQGPLNAFLITTPLKYSMVRTGSTRKPTPETVVDTTIKTFERGLKELGEKPQFVLEIQCIGRMATLTDVGKKPVPPAFLERTRQTLPAGAVLFGFGGSAEIGPMSTGQPSAGVGHQAVFMCFGSAAKKGSAEE